MQRWSNGHDNPPTEAKPRIGEGVLQAANFTCAAAFGDTNIGLAVRRYNPFCPAQTRVPIRRVAGIQLGTAGDGLQNYSCQLLSPRFEKTARRAQCFSLTGALLEGPRLRRLPVFG